MYCLKGQQQLYNCVIVSSYSDFHVEEKCLLVVQTVLVVSGNGTDYGNWMGMGKESWEWGRMEIKKLQYLAHL